MRTLFNLILLLFVSGAINQTFGDTQDSLQQYIDYGLKNNIVLQQKSISYEKATQALKIANGMFSPSVGILVNYTNGDGGRRISIPVGDLLNPVYNTLNQLTGTDNFPQIENVNQNFFPRHFYDARVRTSIPIVNSDLYYNQKIKAQQAILQEYEIESYKRELIRTIKVAYYQYLSAVEGIKIYQVALSRAEEGKRVNESLLKNGKGLPAYVLRSESEIENIKTSILESEKQADNAQMYFNFLINRELESPIDIKATIDTQMSEVPAVIAAEQESSAREEFKQLIALGEINQNLVRMNSHFWTPKLSGFADIGAQSENFKYNSNANYYLVGVQLEIPLFAGLTNRYKISQAKLDVKNNDLQQQLLSKQLKLSSHQSKNNLASAYQNYLSSLKQLEAVNSYQKLIEKGYKEGVNTFIETIDARNQLTSSQLLVTINQFKVMMAQANLERETASYPLN